MHNNQNFSYCNRDANFNILEKNIFDLVIIGGGITGAGIALEAISRGLKTVLIEQNDFASGTSSKSTKLVHGGLRYLEQAQFAYVAKLGREREIIKRNAQHNVIAMPVLLPIYKNGQLNKWLSMIGIKLYDILAGVKREHRMRWIGRQELINRYSFIKNEKLQGACLYYEYKVNDGRLVIETLKKAAELGALCFNYVEAEGLQLTNNMVTGIEVRNLHTKQSKLVQAKAVINATGAWCTQVMQQFKLTLPKHLFPTKGVHLTFTKDKLPIKEAFYCDTPDKRMFFIIPRQNHVYVGTTDTPYQGNLRQPEVLPKDIDYLLEALNGIFPNLSLCEKDIVSCWAGIRPLIKGKGQKPSEVSRHEELFISDTGLVTITGGKLTGYRLMAKKAVECAIRTAGLKELGANTMNISLSGSDWNEELTTHKLVEQADFAFDEAKQTGIRADQFKPLFYRYGTNISLIIEQAYQFMGSGLTPEQLWLKTELWYAVNHEMVINLSDFFIYRTEMLLFEPESVAQLKDFAAEIMAGFLNWSAKETTEQMAKLEEVWKYYKT